MIRRSSSLWALTVAAASAACGALSVTSAAAADLPVAPGTSYYPPAAAYAPALYDWSGIYLGANVGLNVLQDSVTTQTTTSYQPAGASSHLNALGIVGGPQIGANYEIAPWVIGVEGSWQATNASASNTIATTAPNGDNERSTSDEQWYASATGRIGYAFNTVLVYGKGGAAWTRVRYTQTDLNPATGVVTSQQSIDNIRTGFVVGGGVEYGMTEHFSARIEYDFYDFGSKDYNFNSLADVATNPNPFPGAFPVSIKSYSHLITAGLYYRFD